MVTTYEEALREATEQAAGVGVTDVDPNYVKAIQEGTTGQYSNAAIQAGKDQQTTDDSGSGSKSKKSSSNSADDYIDSLYDNKLTAQERQLKMALEDALDEYDKQESSTYSNQILANKYSNEAMLAQGINSGAIGQAALSSNNALQGNLGVINEGRANANEDYQNNLLTLQESIEAEKIGALLNDYYNQQQMDYQTSRDTVSDSQYADSLALQQDQFGLQEQQYNTNLTQNQQEQALQLLQLGISNEQIAGWLGLSESDIKSYADYVKTAQTQSLYSGSSSSSSGSGSSGSSTETKPKLTAAQAYSAWNNGIETTEVITALEYYYGQGDWSTGGGGKFGDSGGDNIAAPTNNSTLEQTLKTYAHMGNNVAALELLKNMLDAGAITQSQMESMIDKYGFSD